LSNTPAEEHDGSAVWLTIGSFDGIHRGHQALIRELVKGAKEKCGISTVVTFDPHPSRYLKPSTEPFYLTDPLEREELLRDMGVDGVITLPFNRELATKSPEEFIKTLHERIPFTCIVVGYDFHFGYQRAGDLDLLNQLGKKYGFCAKPFHARIDAGKPVSSSRIRELIKSGNVHAAAKLLGRAYTLRGEVIHGDGRGRHIGLPTANLSVWHEKLLPADGVYAARAIFGEERAALVSIGTRPTFYEDTQLRTIEAYLLEFAGDIYGQNMTLHLLDRLRGEERFDSAEALMLQIAKDEEKSRKVFIDDARKRHLSA